MVIQGASENGVRNECRRISDGYWRVHNASQDSPDRLDLGEAGGGASTALVASEAGDFRCGLQVGRERAGDSGVRVVERQGNRCVRGEIS